MSQKQVRVVRDEEPPNLALDPKKPKAPGKVLPLNPKKLDSQREKHCSRCGKDPLFLPGIHMLLL